MRPGPLPKPIEERKADGTMRSSYASVPLVVGGRKPPRPSAYLTAAQNREFRRLVRELKDSGLLDSADRGLLELTAIEVATLAECNQHLEEGLTILVTRAGYNGAPAREVEEPSPYLKMREDAVNKLRYIYAELCPAIGRHAIRIPFFLPKTHLRGIMVLIT